MKKLKVALVSPFPPSKGTLNEYAYHLVKHMQNNEGYSEIVVITDKLPEGETYEIEQTEVKVSFKEVWKFNSLTNLWKIIKAVKESNADIVFYNIQFLSFGDKKIAATLGLLTPMMTKLLGLKSVVLLHNIIETVDYNSAGITNNPMMKWIYNFFGTILTMMVLSSDLVAVTMGKYVKILKEKYGATNVVLMPHGSFDLPEIPTFEFEPKKKQVMTFGKFGTYKKVEKMIDAVNIVKERIGEEIEIVIAGTDNPNVKGYLAGVAKKYEYVKDLRFTGYVEEQDVPRIFKESTIVVFPYTSTTGSSGVLHQAGSYGKAVALPNIGDLKDLIEDEGYTGSYFESEDVTTMANAIEKLLTDKAYRIRIAKQNYKAASSLPMSEIVEMYRQHFMRLNQSKTAQPHLDMALSAA